MKWVYYAYFANIFIILLMEVGKRPQPIAINDRGLIKEYHYSKVLSFLFLIPITIVSASRTYFIDTIDYIRMYKAVGTDFASIDFEYFGNVEKGYLYFTAFLNRITDDPQLLFIVSTILIYVCFIIFAYDNSEDLPFSLLLFMCLEWTGTMNGMRQYMAASIVYIFWNYWSKSKQKWYNHLIMIAGIVLAMQFHKSAIICILVYFLARGNFFNLGMKILGVGTFAMFLFPPIYRYVFEVLLTDDTYSSYENVSEGMGIMRFIVGCVPIVLCIIYANVNKERVHDKCDINNWMMNMMLFSFYCSVLALKMVFFSRLGGYFGWYVIVMIPALIKKSFRPDVAKIIKMVAIIMYIIFFLYQMKALGGYMEKFAVCFDK